MSVDTAPRRALSRLGPLLVAVVLVAAAVGVALVWLAVSLVHLDDRERVGHVQGAWMALARYANDGILYPPLFDGERYGGTRWMPLGIVLHAVAARLTGSELIGGKALTLLAGVALLALTLALLRRLGCPWPLAAVLSAAVLASGAGLFTTTTIGADVLAAALGVAALLVFVRWAGSSREGPERAPPARALGAGADRPGVLVAAGVLAGLGPLAKLTAGWALLAIACHLVATRRWRAAGVFVGAAGGTAALGLGVALAVSGGRLWDSVGRLAFAGGTGPVALARAPNQLIYNLTEFAPGLLAVVPLAAGAVLLVRAWREVSVVDWALGWSGVAVLVAFTDIGTGLNQLLDLLVVVVLAAGQLPSRLGRRLASRGHDVGVLAVGLAGATALAAGTVASLVPAARDAVDVARHGHRLATVPLEDVVDRDATLLSEDPYLAVTRDRHPVVLDAFMVRRLDEVDPDLVDPLIARIEAGGFDHVVLVEDLDRDDWWQRYHFGPRVAEAIRGAYEPLGARDGYAVYRPRP